MKKHLLILLCSMNIMFANSQEFDNLRIKLKEEAEVKFPTPKAKEKWFNFSFGSGYYGYVGNNMSIDLDLLRVGISFPIRHWCGISSSLIYLKFSEVNHTYLLPLEYRIPIIKKTGDVTSKYSLSFKVNSTMIDYYYTSFNKTDHYNYFNYQSISLHANYSMLEGEIGYGFNNFTADKQNTRSGIFFKVGIGLNGNGYGHDGWDKRVVEINDEKQNKWIAKEIEMRKDQKGLPPNLFAELSFKDDNNNGILEANESSEIRLKITNKGKGKAMDLKVSVVDDLYDLELIHSSKDIKVIEPSQTIETSISIKAGLNIKTAEHKLKIKVAELFGYDMDDAYLVLNTFAYQEPKIIFSGLEITDNGEGTFAINEDNILQAGEQVKVKMVVQNIGQGIAKNVEYKVTSPNSDIFLSNANGSFSSLNAGETKEIWFNLSPNKRVPSTREYLPIYLTLSESIGRGNLNNYQLPINLNKEPPKTKILAVNSDFESLKRRIAKFEYNSNKFTLNTSNIIDIKMITASKSKRKNSVGVVIGIQNYKELPSAPYAANDAEIMKEYFEKRLGVEKVVIYKNNEISGFAFDDIFNPDNGELQKAVVKGETDVFVFYSGHGIPDKTGDKIYLFPSDGKISRLDAQGYEISKLYSNLEKLGAKSITIFLDACFSGSSKITESTKTENLVSMKGVKIKPKLDKPWITNQNFFVFNSSSGDETSLGFDASESGLFTYYLCLAMQGKADKNNDRKISYGELKQYVIENVVETSKKISGLQTPEFNGIEDKILLEY